MDTTDSFKGNLYHISVKCNGKHFQVLVTDSNNSVTRRCFITDKLFPVKTYNGCFEEVPFGVKRKNKNYKIKNKLITKSCLTQNCDQENVQDEFKVPTVWPSYVKSLNICNQVINYINSQIDKGVTQLTEMPTFVIKNPIAATTTSSSDTIMNNNERAYELLSIIPRKVKDNKKSYSLYEKKPFCKKNKNKKRRSYLSYQDTLQHRRIKTNQIKRLNTPGAFSFGSRRFSKNKHNGHKNYLIYDYSSNDDSLRPLHVPPSFPKPSHLIGLKNFGNTCYMNSVIQAITGIKLFCMNLRGNKKLPAGMLYLFQNILNNLHEGKDPKRALRLFKDYFVKVVFPPFDDNNQHDSSEFLITFLQELNIEAPWLNSHFKLTYVEEYQCKDCLKTTYSNIQEEVILNLSFPNDYSGIYSVQNLLKSQLGRCRSCFSENTNFSIKFLTLPRVLILVLKRYRQTENDEIKKIKTPVTPSSVIQVTKFKTLVTSEPQSYELSSESVDETKFYQYHLSSVVSHFGEGTNIGHYSTDVYRPEGSTWFHYNDESVACSSLDRHELKENCYIFFYVSHKI